MNFPDRVWAILALLWFFASMAASLIVVTFVGEVVWQYSQSGMASAAAACLAWPPTFVVLMWLGWGYIDDRRRGK